MSTSPATAKSSVGVIWTELPVLLRGSVVPVTEWTHHPTAARVTGNVLVIVLGTAAFGCAVGWWRAPLQALYTALKLPLIVLLTTAGNGLLNGMLAPLFGLRIGIRQSLLAVLMSFAISGAVLGAFSPLVGFVVWNAPPLAAGARDWSTHSLILLMLVLAVAFAGIAGNLRLFQLLRSFSGGDQAPRRTVLAWLGVNLLLGTQLSWILRPFVGSPGLSVQFLREDAFHGSFFESVLHAVRQLLWG